MAHRVPVVFEPASVTAWVTPGTTVAAAARVAGVLIAIPCGGRGVCGSCGVRVVAGELDAADPVELAGLKRAPQGVRLACRATVSQAVTVRPIVAQRATAPGRPLIPGVPLVAGVDLGTTSVAAMIVEAETGRELGRASVPNEQQSFGADVLSRISASLDGERASLQEAAEASIDEAIRASSGAAEASASSVQRVVIAGNTAMVALLAGVDAEPLSHHPFDVPFAGRKLPDGTAPRLGLRPECQIELVPPLAAFVGGDALAGALAAGLVEAGRPQLLLDLGTNAEIVLARSGELTVASTAAGPAFEGVGISCGGPAVSGAVESVEVTGSEVTLHSIGDASPLWFSGAGLVSAFAVLLRAGHLAPDGVFRRSGPLESRFSRDLDGVLGVDLGPARRTDGARLSISQLDVRAIQLAKAAVRVGIDRVLACGEITSQDLESVAVAGAFGSAMRGSDLVALGVLPTSLAHRVNSVGDAALRGAAQLALEPALFELVEPLRRGVHHVDLAAEPGFGSAFMAATEFVES